MRTFVAILLALVALAPLAAAQDNASAANETPTDASGDGTTKSPGNESCVDEGCVYKDEPIPYGSPDCIECSGPMRGPEDGSCENCRGDTSGSDGETCMDGAGEGETCDPDVQYLGGPKTTSAQADDAGAEKNAVPAASTVVVLAGFAIAIFLLARRG